MKYGKRYTGEGHFVDEDPDGMAVVHDNPRYQYSIEFRMDEVDPYKYPWLYGAVRNYNRRFGDSEHMIVFETEDYGTYLSPVYFSFDDSDDVYQEVIEDAEEFLKDHAKK